MRPARSRSAVLLAVLALLLLASGVGPSPAAAAAVRDVQLTQDGPVPRELTVEAGDRIRFINTDRFVHRAVSDSPNWAFDTGTLAPGGTFTVAQPLRAAGTYAYRGAGLDAFEGRVVVPGATPAPSRSAAPRPSSRPPVVAVPGSSPTPSAASPAPSGSPSPAAGSSPAPVATGGSGVVQGPPPLAGSSFGGVGGLAPTPVPGAPAPLVAPELAATPAPLAVATPDVVVPELDAAAPVTAAGDLPRLSSPVEARRFGLPMALALLSIAGVGSLLARLLLAEAPRGDGPVAA